jgi:glutamine---fructose-6-phosphate transaminase (isomerizing)
MLGKHMEAEIREQPGVLARGAASYFKQLEPLKGRSYEMVLLTARGSSDNAALYARYLIEIHLGIPVSLAAPSVITRYGASLRYPKTLCVGISQSGAAPDVAEVLGHLREQGHDTLAITNTPDSRITNTAEHTVLLEAGGERSVAATKTYTATLLALYELVRALGGSLPAPDDLPGEEWLGSCAAAAEEGVGPLLRSQILFALARGYSFCTAQESALKLMECALLPCKSFSSADFEHGPKALAGHGSAAIVYGDELPYLTPQGCLVVQAPSITAEAGKHEGVEAAMAPIWEIFFGQWLALFAARARGLDPDDPQHIQKVTETL